MIVDCTKCGGSHSEWWSCVTRSLVGSSPDLLSDRRIKRPRNRKGTVTVRRDAMAVDNGAFRINRSALNCPLCRRTLEGFVLRVVVWHRGKKVPRRQPILRCRNCKIGWRFHTWTDEQMNAERYRPRRKRKMGMRRPGARRRSSSLRQRR